MTEHLDEYQEHGCRFPVVFQIACTTGDRLCTVYCSDFCSLRSGTVVEGNGASSEDAENNETLGNGSMLALPLFNVKSVIYSI